MRTIPDGIRLDAYASGRKTENVKKVTNFGFDFGARSGKKSKVDYILVESNPGASHVPARNGAIQTTKQTEADERTEFKNPGRANTAAAG